MDVTLYDTTLREGTQREGLSLSAEDKVKIARRLDALGVSYIEGGWPGSNPKDAEFFRRMERVPLRQAKLAAFGMTRRAGSRCADDANCRALVDAGTPVVTLVGKRRNTSSTATASIRATRWPPSSRPPTPAPTASSCATPTAARCPPMWKRACGRYVTGRARRWAFTPTTTAGWRSPTRSPR